MGTLKTWDYYVLLVLNINNLLTNVYEYSRKPQNYFHHLEHCFLNQLSKFSNALILLRSDFNISIDPHPKTS